MSISRMPSSFNWCYYILSWVVFTISLAMLLNSHVELNLLILGFVNAWRYIRENVIFWCCCPGESENLIYMKLWKCNRNCRNIWQQLNKRHGNWPQQNRPPKITKNLELKCKDHRLMRLLFSSSFDSCTQILPKNVKTLVKTCNWDLRETLDSGKSYQLSKH